MNHIKFKLSLSAVLLGVGGSAFSQVSDSALGSEEVIVDTKKVKIIVTEKVLDKEAPMGKDSTVRYTQESIQIIRKNKGDTIDLNDDMKNIEIEEEQSNFIETDWFNMQLGLNNLMNTDGKLEMPEDYKDMNIITGKSINFHLHFVQQAMNIVPDHVKLIYGIGIDFNNYRFNKNVILSKDSNNVLASMVDDDGNFKKNKLVTQYLTVPLMLDFTFGKDEDDAAKLAFGANFGYYLGSHQKIKYVENGTHKVKNRDDFNLEKFRIGYEVQFGYGNIILYAKYFPNSIFKKDLGPDLRTVSAGILLGTI